MTTLDYIKANYLHKTVEVVVDRPIHSTHPSHKNIVYAVNYGYIPNTVSDDGEEIDAYILGIDEPIEKFHGEVIALLHRVNDNDDKLIVVPVGKTYTDEQIRECTYFQEKFFKSIIVR